MNIVNFNKAVFEKNKLIIQDAITIDEWKELGQSLKQVEGSVQFWIGDWARFGDKKGFTGTYTDPKVYDELEAITGFTRSTIKKFKHVAENTAEVRESLPRSNDMTFSHFQEVAHLPEDKQTTFLNRAVDEGLSTRQLRNEISRGNESTGTSEKKVAMNAAREIGEKIEFEKRVGELLYEINRMPVLYRMKIKQGIK